MEANDRKKGIVIEKVLQRATELQEMVEAGTISPQYTSKILQSMKDMLSNVHFYGRSRDMNPLKKEYQTAEVRFL